MATKRALLQNILRLCQYNYFESWVKSENAEHDSIDLKCDGPLGTIFRKNIVNEWWTSNVVSAETLMFATSSSCGHLGLGQKPAESDSSDLANNFHRISKLVRNKLPFGTATCDTSHFNPRHQTILNCYRDLNQVTTLNTQHFVSPNTTTRWFHECQRLRLTWWKKLAVTPSNFCASEVEQREGGAQVVSLQYKFPWGTEVVEDIFNCGSYTVPCESTDSSRSGQGQDDPKHVGLIQCCTAAEAAMLVYLLDAVKEKMRGNVKRTILHIHHRLAPYKTGITTVSSPSSATIPQLNHLAQFVRGDLKKAGIMVMWIPETLSMSEEEQNSRFDEMGIPFSIVLQEKSLKNGIIGLRSRDTSLQEQVHLTEIKEKLQLYLQLQ